jgi:hypothetical protein
MNILYFISLHDACQKCLSSRGAEKSGENKEKVIQEMKELLELAHDDFFVIGKSSEDDYAEISTIVTEYSLECFSCEEGKTCIADEIKKLYIIPYERDFMRVKRRGDVWAKNRGKRAKKEGNLIRLKFK